MLVLYSIPCTRAFRGEEVDLSDIGLIFSLYFCLGACFANHCSCNSRKVMLLPNCAKTGSNSVSKWPWHSLHETSYI